MSKKDIEKMSDMELIKEYKVYDSMIYEEGCYSVSDMVYLDWLGEEINKRSLEI